MPKRNILFGIGNPGKNYRFTRHNVGFRLLDTFAAFHNLKWTRTSGSYSEARGNVSGIEVILIKPETYVNLSGKALGDLREICAFEAGELLVLCDDFNLPLGSIRLRGGGSGGGHKGLNSIITYLGTTDFPRLRIGIGPPTEDKSAADFVLMDFTEEETPVLEKVLETALMCVETFLKDGIDMAMNRYNPLKRNLNND
jgi:PTH1 family peptidyl-tRNA hydrolase